MHLKLEKTAFLWLRILLLISVLFLSWVVFLEQQFLVPPELPRVLFQGTWQSEHTAPQPYRSDTAPNADTFPEVILLGHLDQPIAAGERLLLRLQNLRVTIYQNGNMIYTYGQEGSYPALSKSAGNVWAIFYAPEITPEDELRIELASPYDNNVRTAYQDFLGQIIKGDSGVLFRVLFVEYGFTMLLGGCMFLLGCMMLMIIFILNLMHTGISSKPIHFALFAIVSGLWFLFDFQVISLVVPLGVFGNILSMLCFCLLMPTFIFYALDFLQGKAKLPLLVLVHGQLLFTLFYLVTQGLGIYDGFNLVTVLTILFGISICTICAALLYERLTLQNRAAGLLLLSCSMILFSLGDVRDYFLHNAPTYYWTKISYVLFIACHCCYLIYYIRCCVKEHQRMQQLEREVAQSKVAIAVSQIQPHFLFNSLTAIQQLCRMDSRRAELAIGDFANFLRGNLDSLTCRTLIPFRKELSHIKTYLALEQLRFGRRLQVVYEIQEADFQLPTLTVQPLVENAVRYGIARKPEGGTITIQTRRENATIIITVSDDGPAFEEQPSQANGKSHIGIDNVRNRLIMQCGGQLEVICQPGGNTRATIILPQPWEKG